MPMTTGTSTSANNRCLHILVRINADNRVGFGHAVRTSALLEMVGIPLQLTVIGSGVALAAFFPGARIHPAPASFAEFARFVSERRHDAVLVDLPRRARWPWPLLRGLRKPIIAIDDEGGDVIADLVLNGTVLEAYHNYPCLPGGARALVGARYTLIRPEFGRARWRRPPQRSIIIVVGSGKRAHEWSFALASGAVRWRRWGRASMVVGAGFPKFRALMKACQDSGVVLRRGLSARDLAALLAGSSVALTTGGMVVYEALAVGVPTVVFPQIANLVPEAEWFAAEKCVRNLGFDEGMDMTKVAQEVGAVMRSSSLAGRMSKRGRLIVDGRGLERAAAAVADLLGAVLPA
jgi:spore coat polysaccharide biosynthesis predicted glycosyltransferase SpsG